MRQSLQLKRNISFLIVLYTLSFLYGCQNKYKTAVYTPEQFPQTLQEVIIPSSPIPTYSWQPSTYYKKKHTVRIYIEGDGRAWIKSGQPASDPTPYSRVVHSLMISDPKMDIAYIARPCQYVQHKNCRVALWTFDRYSKQSVDQINNAISSIKQRGKYRHIELVGYSGGATIALLVASMRNDIRSIRTVAGNLTPEHTNKLHHVSPMPNAMEPAYYRRQLEHIPQVHFYGNRDSVIPKEVNEHYTKQFLMKRCIRVIEIEADHHQGWDDHWQQMLEETPVCTSHQK